MNRDGLFRSVVVIIAALSGTTLAQAQLLEGRTEANAKVIAEAKALAQRIDAMLEAKMQGKAIEVAPPASEPVLFRRTYLDLAGKIPTLLEMRDYLDDDSTPDKREAWIERLLASDDYAEHFAGIWRSIMLPNNNDFQTLAQAAQFELWLKDKLRRNDHYDVIAKNLLTGLREPGVQGSPSAFYVANGNKAEDMAGATARVLLGVKLECAQCHAHPFAEWTQQQFWEMAAFFNRTNVRYGDDGKFLRQEIAIPNMDKTVKATFLDGSAPAESSTDNGPTVLADWVIARKNPYFARAGVDHVWRYFFGRSLLQPLQEEDETAVKHPELVEMLANEFAAHDFDLKFLIRAIVYTKAYQRSSEAQSENPAQLAYYARMALRGLRPLQLYNSLMQAMMVDESTNANMQQRVNVFNQFMTPRGQFLQRFADQTDPTDAQTTILQALFLMNGKLINDNIRPEPGKAIEILASAQTSHERRIETLYLMALSRLPRPDEVQRLLPYLESGGPTGNRTQALADIFWAMLNSSEFRMNH